jgi:D-alanyl-D-alanine dipeptidase
LEPELIPSWPNQPIIRAILPHTGRLDGDDTGYRDVAVHPEDEVAPDPLVMIPEALLCRPIYAHGAKARITPLYGDGFGASSQILVREPVALALLEADAELIPFNRTLLVLDGFRPAHIQARLWAWTFQNSLTFAGLDVNALTPGQWVRYGRAADDVTSYCACVEDEAFVDMVRQIASANRSELTAYGAPLAVARELVTFQINCGFHQGRLDICANTAHGSGGAVDVILAERSSREPVMMGVHFDSTSPAAVMDWFERNDQARLRRLVGQDEALAAYFHEFDVTLDNINEALFAAVRRERRLLFHAMKSVGASFFSLGTDTGESWHFNLGNERQGRQSDLLYGAGNACHSLLRNIVDPADGRIAAVWGNATAHKLADRTGSGKA